MNDIARVATPQLGLSIAIAAVGILLSACSGRPGNALQQAIAIPRNAVSASCGMQIAGSPGPRGEVFVNGRKTPLIFGSTRDLLGYVLQPENRERLGSIYVQDSAHINWRHPSNAASSFILARKAYYVAWQTQPGSMGPTLATFGDMNAAMAYRQMHGGQILRYQQITPELVSLLSYDCPKPGSPVASLARQCLDGNATDNATITSGTDGMMQMGDDKKN